MRVLLDFDDLHWREPENCLYTIRALVHNIKDIKINFFTIPSLNNLPLYLDKQWCFEIERFIHYGNIRLYVHGLNHSFNEFKNISCEDATSRIETVEQIFNISNLKFGKVFKGPNWGINENTIRALIEKKYTHVYVHPEQMLYDCTFGNEIKFITYTFNLKNISTAKPLVENDDIVIMHGHTHNVCENGIIEISNDLIDFCNKEKPIFKFIEEI